MVVGLEAGEPGAAEARLQHYSGGRASHLYRPQGLPLVSQWTPEGYGLSVWWEALSPDWLGHQRTLDRHAPVDLQTGRRWLRPAFPDGSLPSPLITWWALLFGLSMLARYEPAGWAAALDYDRSELAAPLARLLEAGLNLVPRLVLGGLSGAPEAE